MLNDVTVFDFETSGLNAEKDRVIEMAAIRVVKGEVVSEFSTLVQFEGELSHKITEITGITQDSLLGGLDEGTAFRILNRMIGNSLLVAHNAAFDMSFLHYTLMRLSGRSFTNQFVDTMTISRDRTTYPHKLTDMCGKYGITLDGAHRALNDVQACWELLDSLNKEKDVTEWINKLGYLSKYSPPSWVPSWAEVFPTQNKYD